MRRDDSSESDCEAKYSDSNISLSGHFGISGLMTSADARIEILVVELHKKGTLVFKKDCISGHLGFSPLAK